MSTYLTYNNAKIKRIKLIIHTISDIYHLTLDELTGFDINLKEIEQAIENTSEETQQKVDWTSMWGKKYPVLTTYRQKVEVKYYGDRIKELLDSLKNRYGYNDLDAMLVLKDILAHIWNVEK